MTNTVVPKVIGIDASDAEGGSAKTLIELALQDIQCAHDHASGVPYEDAFGGLFGEVTDEQTTATVVARLKSAAASAAAAARILESQLLAVANDR